MAPSATTSTARGYVSGTVQDRRESRPRRSRSLAVVAALLLMAVFAAGCDWLQPGFDGGHSNFNPLEPALTASTVRSLTKRFSVPTQGMLSSPLVVEGKIAYSNKDASGNVAVTTVNANTGAPGWTTTVSELNVNYTTGITSDGTNIYIAGQKNPAPPSPGVTHVVALSAANGAIVWDANLGPGGYVDGTPEVAGGRLFLLSASERSEDVAEFMWTALDAGTGKRLWNYNAQSYVGPDYMAGTTATTDDSVAVTTATGTVILNAADGSVKWSSTSLPPGESAVLYAGAGGLFFGRYGPNVSEFSTTDHLVAVDANTGAIKWDTPDGADLADPRVITGSLAIVGDDPTVNPVRQHKLEALDINTGLVQWVTYLPGGTTSVGHPVVAGDLIYVVTSDGTTNTLRTYDVATGAPVSATAVSGAGVVVAEGHVYVTSPSSLDAYTPAS